MRLKHFTSIKIYIMNRNLFFSLAIGVLILSACKKEERNDGCIQTDFIGTYTGTNKCDGEDPEDVTFSNVEMDGDLFFYE